MNLVELVVLVAEGDTPAKQGGGMGSLMLPVMLIGLVVLFWLMNRRGKKQQGKVEDFRRALTLGTRVMTVGGMVGVISDLEGDVVTIKSASGHETQYTRRAIREAVTDDMWESMTMPYPVEGEEANVTEGDDAPDAADAPPGIGDIEVPGVTDQDEPDGKDSK